MFAIKHAKVHRRSLASFAPLLATIREERFARSRVEAGNAQEAPGVSLRSRSEAERIRAARIFFQRPLLSSLHSHLHLSLFSERPLTAIPDDIAAHLLFAPSPITIPRCFSRPDGTQSRFSIILLSTISQFFSLYNFFPAIKSFLRDR